MNSGVSSQLHASFMPDASGVEGSVNSPDLNLRSFCVRVVVEKNSAEPQTNRDSEQSTNFFQGGNAGHRISAPQTLKNQHSQVKVLQ